MLYQLIVIPDPAKSVPMLTFGTFLTTAAGIIQIWAAVKWRKLNSIQKIALLALFTPTIILGILLFIR